MTIQPHLALALRPIANFIAGHFQTIEYSEHQGQMIHECGQSMKSHPHYRMVTSPKLLACRHRYCPFCQHERVENLQQQVNSFMEIVESSGAKANWLVLILYGQQSIVNCLKRRLEEMESAFTQLTRRRFAQHILGCIRFLEVSQDQVDSRLARPRFRCLLLVTTSMFEGADCVSEAQWAERWRNFLNRRTTPEVHLMRLVGSAHRVTESVQNEIHKSMSYSDDFPSEEWFLEMTRQVQGVPTLNVDGVLKPWLTKALEDQEEDLARERRYSIAKSSIQVP